MAVTIMNSIGKIFILIAGSIGKNGLVCQENINSIMPQIRNGLVRKKWKYFFTILFGFPRHHFLNVHNIGRVRAKLLFENSVQSFFRNRLRNVIDDLKI